MYKENNKMTDVFSNQTIIFMNCKVTNNQQFYVFNEEAH
jgi:hypothetical protein